MAATLQLGKINLGLDLILTNLVGVANVQAAISRPFLKALTSGTGSDQVDKVFSETRTIAASGNFDYDLAGTLLDAYGSVCTFVKVKLIAIFADPGNTNNVVLGNAAATQFLGPLGAAAHTVHTRPGGISVLFAPGTALDSTLWPVGAGATDLLRVTNSAAGTGVTYDIVIAGTSA